MSPIGSRVQVAINRQQPTAQNNFQTRILDIDIGPISEPNIRNFISVQYWTMTLSQYQKNMLSGY